MAQAALSIQPTSGTVNSYSLPSHSLLASNELRLDAGHYSPDLFLGLGILERSQMRLERLGDLVSRVYLPPRFRRIYVGEDAGIPFLQGSHVVQFRPADVKYLSAKSYRSIDHIIIRAGWLLLTRSGTVGRVALCPAEWDGWAASEHIIRIVPDEGKCPAGYLCSFLASSLGQVQLGANIHGAVVDELTDDQVGNILVPVPESEDDAALMRSVDAAMKKGVRLKTQAVASTEVGLTQLEARFQTSD